MYRILSASKDTYITNKITKNNFRSKDANVGMGSTIDLFKLYDESVSGSDSAPIELSRALIKFDLSKIYSMNRLGSIDMNDDSFEVKLILKDVYGGQTTPNNFKLIAFPLAKSFDEGIGRDIVTYKDVGAANFITASYQNGQTQLWDNQGAMKSGSLGVSNIDVIVSGTLAGPDGSQYVNLSREQLFLNGEEDLSLDITKIISGTVSGQITDHGFLIAYSGSYEKDKFTYFVKRFGSNQSLREDIRPHLSVKFDDSIIDNHENFIFNVSGSIFLNNFHKGTLSNILTGKNVSEVSGLNCLKLRVVSGSYSETFNVSQHRVGEVFQNGIYSSSFAISEFDDNLKNYLKKETSASFDLFWSSNDLSIGYFTSSMVVNKNRRTSFNGSQKRLLVVLKNLKDKYNKDSVVKVRVFIEDRDRSIVFKKSPFETRSQVYSNMHYRVLDSQTGEIIIPFDTTKNSTILSSDSEGMYFNLYMDGLIVGRSYKIEFLIKDLGHDELIQDVSANFTILN